MNFLELPFERPLTPPPSYQEAMGWVPPPSTMGSTATLIPQDATARISVSMICPLCQEEIETTTVIRRGRIAYVASALVIFTTFGLGCWLVPCIMKSFNEVHHSCPSCKESLGNVSL
ncbi:cell death-inducing p53-target protein 1 [Drosophila eugracilis]|uniref:cell death-inducing p53-target protein 1 n=1 Tax=Drosophila eugracilis TaxID=29029 RepID=UPI0007E836FA|nr:cell death-inducing p53-target protein 1 [Drosophila eugracilis]